jgi:hypothetical protein
MTVMSVPNSRIDVSAAAGVVANSTSSQPKAPTAAAVAPPTMKSQMSPDFADI